MEKPIDRGEGDFVSDSGESDSDCGLDSIEPSKDLFNAKGLDAFSPGGNSMTSKKVGLSVNENESLGDEGLDELLRLCDNLDETGNQNYKDNQECEDDILICCPLCGADISSLKDEERQVHTNECLDKFEGLNGVKGNDDEKVEHCRGQVVDVPFAEKVKELSPIAEWLHNLGLSKYEEVFTNNEIDMVALQWLTEEDLCTLGITALGPRKKIVHAMNELRNDNTTRDVETRTEVLKVTSSETKSGGNKLITDFFVGFNSESKKRCVVASEKNNTVKSQPQSAGKKSQRGDSVRNVKQKDVPSWCCIPGTPFRVDAFKHLRRDCSHWFLSHFHLDHYQGLTKSFCHGMIYCSSITAKLVNLKIGIPMQRIHVLPLNQKINIAGVDVTCFDANHCPGAVIILFEPPNGKPVLHTGDFRFSEQMTEIPALLSSQIHTLILDTTYCDSQYTFPKQDTIIQFVIDAIQAEAFNSSTLFLIGSYTIGKERLFLEVARVLRKKVHVSAAKLRLLECLELPKEDMQWLTLNEEESHIHVVPMWTIATFKRLKQMANQYMGRFNLVVSFSPTGWSFGKGKQSTGKKWRQGTIIRYEVPYSEHSSFTELKEFVKFISPTEIIPSVNNHSTESQKSMVSQLLA